MSAYLIFTRERTIDQSELDVYGGLAPATAVGHNMTMLARYGDFEVQEGTAIEGSVVLRFPTFEEAKAYYDSPSYRAAAAHRHAGADYRAFIVQGID